MLQQWGLHIQQQILQNLKLYSAGQPTGSLPVTTSAVGICFSSVASTYSNRYYKTWSCTAQVSPLGHYPWLPAQLECASAVWPPHTATDITKFEAVQCMSTRWVTTRGYQRTSSVTQMIKDLNWRPLEQRRIDGRLTPMYKITYDIVAIPAAVYLFPNTRQSRHNHQLAYRQIPTLKNYCKYTFFPRTIVHWNALPFYIHILPTVAQFRHAVCQVTYTALKSSGS